MALTQAQIDALEAELLASISDPERVETDAGSVTMASLSSRLAALRELRATSIRPRQPGGVTIMRAKLPGAVGPCGSE